jgi:hypothetical protein
VLLQPYRIGQERLREPQLRHHGNLQHRNQHRCKYLARLLIVDYFRPSGCKGIDDTVNPIYGFGINARFPTGSCATFG